MISTRRQGVFMAHICSECGFPMITVVQIEAEAQKTYTFSQSKAEQIASETAENAINKEILRIEACYYTKQPLVGQQKERGMIAPGHFCTSSFSGFESYCPKCSSIEPWKSIASKKKMDELEKDNFPIVFKNAKDAEKWAFDKVRSMLPKIEAKREDEFEIERAINEVKQAKTNILVWVHQMNSLPERTDYNRLNDELSIAKKQKESLGLLDFKAKKSIDERIKTLEPQVKMLKDTLDKKIGSAAKQIVSEENKLLTTQAIAFGYTDNILSTQSGQAFSFFFSPVDIPADIMAEIRADVENALSDKQNISNSESFHAKKTIYNEENIYCRKCGFKLLPGSNFCSKCGLKVE